MKRTNFNRRAAAGLLSATMAITPFMVAVPTATADDTQQCAQIKIRPGRGAGELSMDISRNYKPGEVVTIKGSGFEQRPAEVGSFAFKIDDNQNKWPVEQPDTRFDRIDTPATDISIDAASMLSADGSFEVQVKLPENLKDGAHVIRALTGNDGGTATSVPITFTVNSGANDGHCGTLVEGEPATGDESKDTGSTEQPAVEPSESAAPTSKPDTGETKDQDQTSASATVRDVANNERAKTVTANVALEGFAPGVTLTAKVNGQAVLWGTGRNASENPIEVGADGMLEAGITLQPGSAPAGKHTLIVTASDGKTAQAEIVTTAGVQLASTSANSETTVTVYNLPDGAVVTEIGAKGKVFHKANEVEAKNHIATVEGVKLPKDAPVGEPVFVRFVVDGEQQTATGAKITADNSPVAADSYSSTSAQLPTGLYQSAVNASTNELFVTRAVGRPPIKESTLFKLDATTLAVKQQATPAVVDADHPDKGVHAVYGIGLDNQRGLVWVSNTRSGSVAVYKQSDLSLVKQFPAGIVEHARDIAVDESTGKAYVSSPTGNGVIAEVSLDGSVRTIAIGDGFGGTMALALDQSSRTLVTVSLNQPAAALIDLASGNVTRIDLPEGQVDRASGVAWDAKRGNIFVASQGSSNVVVYNVNDKKVVAEVPTGAGALNAVYDPVNDRVYVTNRVGGTVTVLDAESFEISANLPAGANTNHTAVASNGVVYTVQKGATTNEQGESVNLVYRFALNESTTPDEGNSSTTEPTTPGDSGSASEPTTPGDGGTSETEVPDNGSTTQPKPPTQPEPEDPEGGSSVFKPSRILSFVVSAVSSFLPIKWVVKVTVSFGLPSWLTQWWPR
ncbi:YncE family protein [Corynebacterium gerontici]|uniref:Virginiamycin B lyase n=1 Tax=Corynebacterium gerontici TaxID=2079234 RepID=A0A3G6J2J7_9CORY|nr:hypothetical protein [Corynebacterium gerontici]AZA12126.1 hypothetical protein CGERO_09175 [Corynebacterium gerontici]